jgi:hypothetical protein
VLLIDRERFGEMRSLKVKCPSAIDGSLDKLRRRKLASMSLLCESIHQLFLYHRILANTYLIHYQKDVEACTRSQATHSQPVLVIPDAKDSCRRTHNPMEVWTARQGSAQLASWWNSKRWNT